MADDNNDIEKYLKGELTPSQMHALEKRALDDPFLADALEGAQQVSVDDFLADVHDLRESVQKRVLKKKANLWSPWLRIAAGLLLLGACAYLIVFMSNRREQGSENLALNEQKELRPSAPDKDAAPTEDSMLAEHKGATGDEDEPSSNEQKKQRDASSATPRSEAHQPMTEISEAPQQIVESKDDARQPVPSKEEDAKQTTKPEAEITVAQETDPALPDPAFDAGETRSKSLERERQAATSDKSVAGGAAKAPSAAYTASRRVVRGKVTFSEDGTGLPGVNVMVTGTNEGTVTDAAGDYEIPVDGTNPTLSFSFIGFTGKEVEVKSDQLDVQLDADVSELSEVVVVGYGEKSLGDLSTTPPVMELASPAGGRRAFKQYLEKNLHYPEQALKNEVEGKVTIQFTIGMTGQLSDFKVIRGIGYGCDEEVIRLIKAGPKWTPTKKNDEPVRDRVRVRMRFSLPKK